MMNRRSFSLMAGACLVSCSATAAPEKVVANDRIAKALRELERASRGRLGVHILDTATGAEFGHRSDERFLMCSTVKLLACGFALHRVDQGQESLSRGVPYGRADLLANSPVTEQHVAAGSMTLGELCEATLTTSDNAAANLIIASYGGPAALTAYARTLGDTVTRVDRYEPMLNDRRSEQDTTSPRAMLHTVQRLVLGDALSPASRETLQRWMLANTTGQHRLRGGLPQGWRLGDKTGSGNGTSNDIGVVWPPKRAPLIVTAYLTESPATNAGRERTLADVGRLVARLAA